MLPIAICHDDRFVSTEIEKIILFYNETYFVETEIAVGWQIRHELNDYLCKIIFISCHEGYEIDLFEVQPLHFSKTP